MNGHPGEEGGLGMTEGDMDMDGGQQMGEDHIAPQVENVEESGMN